MKIQRHALIAAMAVFFSASGRLPVRATTTRPAHAPAGLLIVQEEVLIRLEAGRHDAANYP